MWDRMDKADDGLYWLERWKDGRSYQVNIHLQPMMTQYCAVFSWLKMSDRNNEIFI